MNHILVLEGEDWHPWFSISFKHKEIMIYAYYRGICLYW